SASWLHARQPSGLPPSKYRRCRYWCASQLQPDVDNMKPSYTYEEQQAGAARGHNQVGYSVCTSTTPDTALIAPAICGETLKRPGSFISTSVSRSSISTSDTSPSPLPPAPDAGFAAVPREPFCGAASGPCSRRTIDSSGFVSRKNI